MRTIDPRTKVSRRLVLRGSAAAVPAVAAGMTISEIFAKYGEPEFRRLERSVIGRLLQPDERNLEFDIYNPLCPNKPPFSKDFVAAFRQAQWQRNHKITQWAQELLESLKKRNDGEIERGFVTHRTMCDVRWIDSSIDPNGRKPGICYMGAALLLIPGFLGTSLTPAVWFDVAGAGLISAANPPIQAARLDVVPAGLWGRAQSALTFVRSVAQALAPLVFGGVSQLVAGIVPSEAPIGTHPHAPSSSTTTGLQVTFLIMISALAAAGVLLFRARRTFASDVATAAASEPEEGTPATAA